MPWFSTVTAAGLLAAALILFIAAGFLLLRAVGKRQFLGTAQEQATYETLHTASLAAPPLRATLNTDSARRAGRHLRALLDVPALAMTDAAGTVLVWDGAAPEPGHDHRAAVPEHAGRALAAGRTEVIGPGDTPCNRADCALRQGVVVPLTVAGRPEGALAVYTSQASTGLVRATTEVARWVSTQLELAELDRSRAAVAEAEVRALRAQISPHFIYNSLSAIASFVRTDPARARELLVEFAEFTRYSFRQHGDFTSLAEELRCIDRYLLLERARFGGRLQVSLRVAPEVLSVAVPFLCLQPLVENAVRHGLERRAGPGHLVITAEDVGSEAWISVEDDGTGMDPEQLAETLRGETRESAAQPPGSEHRREPGIGLRNIDERLRQVYGDAYGLIVETAPGAGTKVRVRVPKFHPQAVQSRAGQG
ncbi:sensor histidine kinase [Wenjunlia tyrosinilytica]|uniref:Signal transduction histidine kinase n=1 Tax=Wenjunlia tyrosinilytica TaxID=1544741 RepID=A0A918DYS4_9ACTN|nr:histidine kinase [Wenjunlia tyrosinilytica]GGO91657.1 signal transduction histidine kinase [Wenjunlia tyrosinilytica]